VKLHLSVFCPDGEPSAVARWHPWTELNRAEEPANDNPYAATRRAIVRAAAAIADSTAAKE
jgi:hypothetical protein